MAPRRYGCRAFLLVKLTQTPRRNVSPQLPVGVEGRNNVRSMDTPITVGAVSSSSGALLERGNSRQPQNGSPVHEPAQSRRRARRKALVDGLFTAGFSWAVDVCPLLM